MASKIREMIAELEPIKERACKELKILNSKDVLSPTEASSMGVLMKLCKDYMTMKKDASIVEGMEEYGEGESNRSYPRNYSMEDRDYSMRRNRSTTTGRFMNEGYSMTDVPYDNRFSGHSINDMMIDSLERLYDRAETDHQRNEIRTEIERLRRK